MEVDNIPPNIICFVIHSRINTCILITQRKLNTNSQSYHFRSPSLFLPLSLCFDKIHFYLMLNQKAFILSSDKKYIVQHNTARYMFISHAFPELISLLFLRIPMMNNNFFYIAMSIPQQQSIKHQLYECKI